MSAPGGRGAVCRKIPPRLSADHRGGDPALLPPGGQCLDWSERHRRVGAGSVLRGHQAVPHAEDHPGEQPLGF